MDKFREKVALRGTADCPFQQYLIIRNSKTSFITAAHWHPEFEIIYMLEGKIELKSNKQTYTLFPGEIAFISPGRLHSIIGLEEKTRYHAFVFSLDLISLPQSHFFQKQVIEPIKMGSHQFPPVLHTNALCYYAVSNALDRILQFSKDAPNRKQIVFSSIISVFVSMMDHMENCTGVMHRKNSEPVKNALQYMTDHFSEHLTLDDIANHVHLHPNYLCSLFKDYTGQTVFQHLNRIRIEHAAELLKGNTRSVTETASQCGFENTVFFSKKFKELMGISPKEYSLKHR